MILLIGHTHAGELDLVVQQLRSLGFAHRIMRLNLNDLAYNTPISININSADISVDMHHPVHGKVNLLDAKLAWLAYAPILWTNLLNDVISWPLIHALEADLQDQFRGAYKILTDAGMQWISHPSSVMEFSKITELVHALQAGFLVPNTWISAYEPGLLDQLKGERAIVKSLFSQSVSLSDTDWMASYTKMLDAEHINKLQRKRAFNAPPVVIQPYINKKYEVRLFFFLKRYWAVKIDSQKYHELKVDWRRNPHMADSLMTKMEIPDQILFKSRRLMQDLGLRAGAFDFIIGNDDNWYFLEVNRTPSWNWMSKHVGEDIATGIAEALIDEYEKLNTKEYYES